MTANLLNLRAPACSQAARRFPNTLYLLLTSLLLVLSASPTPAKATILLLPPNSPDLVTFEEPLSDGWTSNGFKLVNSSNLEDLEVRRLSIPAHGVVVLPQLSMTGSKWARLEKGVRGPAFMQVSVEFSLFVSGYQKNLSSTGFLLDNNPDLELTWGQDGGESLTLANISMLQPQQRWQRYRALVRTGPGATGEYKLQLKASRGGGEGVLALDDISVDLVPLVGEQYVREEEEEEEDISTEEEGRNSTPPTKKTTFVNEVNGTEMQPTPSEGENPTTEKAEGGSTVDAGIGIGEGGEGGGSTEVSLAPNSGPTRPSPACANNSSNCTEAELMAEQKQDTSVYGYTGEVVLICLTVIFAVLFLMMVVKFQRLRTHFGDYQLERTAGPAGVRPPEYDNPAYQVQMSYRQGD